ncbi:hypothetical protein [Alcanivorax sp.]|uniref:hypothetical protein n=1 Tax=Alcanivorax sp. TaxID=1872427 RepID=UPI000C0D048B|nr:hypothetical protein [Alcanivorax sp.]PHR67316.1 MAG: hypothetical protein COA55_07160 [Alcanivorax sp.]
MPFYRSSFRHTFSTGDTVELTSHPYPANSWEHARQLADAFGYEDVRIAVEDRHTDGRITVYPMLTSVE